MAKFDSEKYVSSWFPLLIEIRENAKGYEKGTRQIVFFPADLPNGVSFTVLETNYYEEN